jgi:hypothetical protein
MLDKGVIVGIEQNISYKESLGFVLFKMSPKVNPQCDGLEDTGDLNYNHTIRCIYFYIISFVIS